MNGTVSGSRRRMTVASAVVLIVATIPVVWLIGYQDHPWRRADVAVAVAVVAIAASVAAVMAGRDEEPPVSRVLTGAALGVSLIAFLSTLVWVWANYSA